MGVLPLLISLSSQAQAGSVTYEHTVSSKALGCAGTQASRLDPFAQEEKKRIQPSSEEDKGKPIVYHSGF